MCKSLLLLRVLFYLSIFEVLRQAFVLQNVVFFFFFVLLIVVFSILNKKDDHPPPSQPREEVRGSPTLLSN